MKQKLATEKNENKSNFMYSKKKNWKKKSFGYFADKNEKKLIEIYSIENQNKMGSYMKKN